MIKFRVTARDLPYGEFAIALYASDTLPLPGGREATMEEIVKHAERGLVILGGPERLRGLHAALLRANEALLGRDLADEEYSQRVYEILADAVPTLRPNLQRLERCTGLDYRRLLDRPPVGDRCSGMTAER